jgi:hypothetical protein
MPKDTNDTAGTRRDAEAMMKEHEDLDVETLVDDAAEFFAPDNDQIPPPSPDAPPPDH